MNSTDSFGNAVVGLQLPQNFCVLKSETPSFSSPSNSSSPPLSSLHFRSNAAALSTMLMFDDYGKQTKEEDSTGLHVSPENNSPSPGNNMLKKNT